MIGIEEKDMIINRIPAKTWNHLHMNQSKVGEVVINRTEDEALVFLVILKRDRDTKIKFVEQNP